MSSMTQSLGGTPRRLYWGFFDLSPHHHMRVMSVFPLDLSLENSWLKAICHVRHEQNGYYQLSHFGVW